MSFAAGMGAGIGTGVAIGMAAGKKLACSAIRDYLQLNGLTILDSSGAGVKGGSKDACEEERAEAAQVGQ
jgi:hypothetical protein